MRRVLGIGVFLFLFAALGASGVRADEYTATFACDGTCAYIPVVTGDVSFPTPTEIVVDAGATFTLELSAPEGPDDSYTWEEVDDSGLWDFAIGDTSGGVLILSEAKSSGPGGTPGEVFGGGTLVFTPVAAPEPSSLALLLASLGMFALMVMRKRTSLAPRWEHCPG